MKIIKHRFEVTVETIDTFEANEHDVADVLRSEFENGWDTRMYGPVEINIEHRGEYNE